MTAQPLRIVDAALDRYDETLIEWYRSMPPTSRAILLAKSVLADVSPSNPSHRELARMVLADQEERSHV
jgi:hypothetical protein